MTNGIRTTVFPTILAAGLLLAATPGVARAQYNAAARLTGTWNVTLTVRNCATGEPVTTIKELATFSRGGTMIASTAGLAPAAKTPGHGAWRHLTGLSYAYSFKFFRFDPATGALAGWTIIRQEALVNASGDDYTSEGGAEFYNTAGVQVGSACSTISATRFE